MRDLRRGINTEELKENPSNSAELCGFEIGRATYFSGKLGSKKICCGLYDSCACVCNCVNCPCIIRHQYPGIFFSSSE